MKIHRSLLYFPAVIDFKENQAFFPHVRAEDYLGNKEPVEIQFVEGTNVHKIMKLLGRKLSKLIAIDMCNNNNPEPHSDFNLESVQLSEWQKTVMVVIDMKSTLHKVLNKPIRKTVTIPLKLNNIGIRNHWNFSQLLSDAICTKIKQSRRKNHEK